MNSGATAERVYEGLKGRILTRGFHPGERLDPAKLAGEFHSSVTPVRDSLHLLAGEGLVETRLSDGFHMPAIDAPALQDLYDWNCQILSLALRTWRDEENNAPDHFTSRSVTDSAVLFREIAALSSNLEHHRAIVSLNDRLNAVRLCELLVLPNGDGEVEYLWAALRDRDKTSLRNGMKAYHRRRRTVAHELVRQLYR